MIHWEWLPFAALDTTALYGIMAARQEVFVVEQHCAYRDADGRDTAAWHLIGWDGERCEREVAAYLRVLLPGARFAEHSIGRVLTTAPFRGQGLGRELMLRGLARVAEQFGTVPIRIAAQAHLADFYGSLGFVAVGGTYDEDGIPHINMLRLTSRATVVMPDIAHGP